MAGKPALSRGELEAARVLWRLGEATPRQVHEAFPSGRQVDFGSVQTYLKRMEAKGYLRTRREGRAKFYRSRVRPRTVIGETIDDFVERLFDGEALPLMRYLIHDRGITRQEIDELRKLLNQGEDEDDEPAR
jgi:predicted transcriptional regulator